jgi:hypothetical protein
LSQLYILIILLLIFSQDLSFGSDAFKRVIIPTIRWYKERNLRNVSLGSVLLLCLLRAITFNLNRLHDPFLLSNCCAILLNLSTSMVELHDYAAMRFVAVTASLIKKYISLRKERHVNRSQSPAVDDEEEDPSTPLGMHGEVTRTLLQVLNHCFSTKNLDRNLHLVYALVYHQIDYKRILLDKGKSQHVDPEGAPSLH